MSCKANTPHTAADINAREGVIMAVIVQVRHQKSGKWIRLGENKGIILDEENVEFLADAYGADWMIVEDAVTGADLGEHHASDLRGIFREG